MPSTRDGVAAVARYAVGLPRSTKRLLMLGADVLLLPLALWVAVALRSGRPVGLSHCSTAVLVTWACGLPLLWVLGLYSSVTRFAGVRVLSRIALAVTLATVLLFLLDEPAAAWHVRYSALAIFWAFALLSVAGTRALVQGFCVSGLRAGGRMRIAIYGAGDAGVRLSRFLVGGSEYEVVAFVDDEPTLQGRHINGISVHPADALPALVGTHRIQRVLLAIPSVSRRRRSEVLADLEPLGVHVQSLPDLSDLISGTARIDDLREVEVADLLGRDPVPPDPMLFESCIRDKSVMVTGAGGSIGSELCRQILQNAPKVLILKERSELALYQIERELRAAIQHRNLPVELVPLLGDAGDRQRMTQVMQLYGVQTVYHAAAYKHVPIVEHNVIAGLSNNALGTWHAAEAARDAGVETFVLISTDKAVNPPNVMGASKRLAELILQGLQERSEATRFCMVRFGNVLGSSGSVVPLFREQIRCGGPVTVTHPQVVRYFMTIPEAAQLVIQAGSMAGGGDVFVLDMGDPVRIDDLARRMINLTGLSVRDAAHPDGDIEIRYTGLRPAEKLFEELLIGSNVGRTRHPMIMRALEQYLPWDRIRGILDELQAAIDALDCSRAIVLLSAAVTEYIPTGDLSDHIWTADAEARTPLVSGDSKVTSLLARRRQQEGAAGRGWRLAAESASPLPP